MNVFKRPVQRAKTGQNVLGQWLGVPPGQDIGQKQFQQFVVGQAPGRSVQTLPQALAVSEMVLYHRRCASLTRLSRA